LKTNSFGIELHSDGPDPALPVFRDNQLCDPVGTRELVTVFLKSGSELIVRFERFQLRACPLYVVLFAVHKDDSVGDLLDLAAVA